MKLDFSSANDTENLKQCQSQSVIFIEQYLDIKSSYFDTPEPYLDTYRDTPELSIKRKDELERLASDFFGLCKDFRIRQKRDALVRYCLCQKMVELEKDFKDPLIPNIVDERLDHGLTYELKKLQVMSEDDIQNFQYRLIDLINDSSAYISQWKPKYKYKVSIDRRDNEYFYIDFEEPEKFKQENKVYCNTRIKIKRNVYENIVRLYQKKEDDKVDKKEVEKVEADKKEVDKVEAEKKEEVDKVEADKKEEDDKVEAEKREEDDKLDENHFEKNINTHDHSNDYIMLERIFCMIHRYQALGGDGYQAAVTKPVFNFLGESLGVSHECFASPLNCTLDSFGSAFYDIDKYFGSIGSFYSMRGAFPEGGSFEANPPFIEDFILAFAVYIDRWMKDPIPLSFVIFLPGWHDAKGIISMKESQFNKFTLQFSKDSHHYINGSHYYKETQNNISYCDSYVIFMQNDQGASKWPITDNTIEEFNKIFTKR